MLVVRATVRAGREAVEGGAVEYASSLAEGLAARPDFAVVAHPTHLHVATALELLRAGTPILLEKPVGCAEAGLAELAAAARAPDAPPVMVGYQLRCHPAWAEARRWVAAGRVGRVLAIDATVGQYLPTWRPMRDYRTVYTADVARGGGVLFDLSHALDLARALGGEVDSLIADAGRISPLEIAAEDWASVTMRHAEGARSTLRLDCIRRDFAWRTRIEGEGGAISWDYGQERLEWIDADGRVAERWTTPAGFDRDALFRAQMEHWLAVLRGEAEPTVSLAEGIAVTRLAIAAHAAAATGRRVELGGRG